MGTTFVEIAGRGFWMRDTVLELWLRLLALHVEDPVDRDGSLETRIRDQWLLASRGYFNGAVPVNLGEYVDSESGRAIVTNAIKSLMDALAEAPPQIDSSGLRLLGLDPACSSSIERERLIDVGKAFLGLISGTFGGDPSDTSFMPGSR